MKLYSRSHLQAIQNHLLDNQLKFKLDEHAFHFTKSQNYLINRTQNSFLGLAYDTDSGTFIVNYPHLNNISKGVDLSTYIIQPKFNGTNIGFVKHKNETIWRTRGTIKPESVYNSINITLVTKEMMHDLMVTNDVFERFKQKYLPIFEQGLSKQLITQAGEFNVKIPCNKLLEKVSFLFDDKNVVGVFGELISKYNPIPVDANLEFGMYLHDENDFCYYIFDLLKYDDVSQTYYLEPLKTGFKYKENGEIKYEIQTVTEADLSLMNDKPRYIEGFVLKGEVYYKMKWEEILSYERFVSNGPHPAIAIIYTSLNHVLEKMPITDEDIESGKLKDKQIFVDIYQDVVEELQQSINFDEFVDLIISKEGVKKENVDTFVFNKVKKSLHRYFGSKIAVYLMNKGVEKRQIYLKLPEYLWFDEYPIVFNEKRGKYVPKFDWYGRLISNVIYGGKYENV